MTVLPEEGPPIRADRPATQLLHDEPNARIVCFNLAAGQEVPAHRSESTVVIQVLEGQGIFSGAEEAARLGPGQTAVYAPGELHAMHPIEGSGLRFLAIMTPRPG